MYVPRLFPRLAALLSVAFLVALAPSAWADSKLVAHWPFKKKESCEPAPTALPAPELVPPPAQKEPEKKEPEKKVPEIVPPIAQPPMIAPPLVEAPETGPA